MYHFFFSKFVKYNFTDLNNEIRQTVNWLGALVENIYIFINAFLLGWVFKLISNNLVFSSTFKTYFNKINNILISMYLSIISIL